MNQSDALLAGRYRLVDMIASGGSAYVYRAVDERTRQTVAVKVLKPEFTSDSEFILRFKKEVQASLKLHHANIIRAYDAGLDNGRYYIVMELIDGGTLKTLIQERGPLDERYVVSVAKKLCLALEYAHVKGFIHRDIKPHNVMIDQDGEPYIADFGIARNIASNTITADENSVMGSVHYFSPEQARGERVDKRTDIYSLGILLYEMLTGAVPFDADSSIAIALKHINEPLPDLHRSIPNVAESLNRILQKATQKDKHFRYKTPFSMYEDLMRALSETDGDYVKYTESKRSTKYVTEPQLKQTVRTASPKKTKRILAALVCAAAALGTWAAVIHLSGEQSPVPFVVGATAEEAVETIEAAGFEVSLVNETSDEPVGHVTRQQPDQGAAAKLGSVIELFVSEGAGADLMPNVTDMPLQQAQSILRGLGLSVVLREEPQGTYSVGYVVKQEPLPGASLSGVTNVVLAVKTSGDGLRLVVPSVGGEDLGTGLNNLANAGFSCFYIHQVDSTDRAADTILRQEPAPETELPSGQPVSLYVSASGYTQYRYPGDVTVRVDEDNTKVAVGIREEAAGVEAYTIIASATLDRGLHTMELDEIAIESDSPFAAREMVILLDDVPAQNWQVELERMERASSNGDES